MLDHEWTELRMDSTPKGLNPNWDSIPTGTQLRMDSITTGTQPRLDWTQNGTQPRMALFHRLDIQILLFSLNMNQSVPISKEWIKKK